MRILLIEDEEGVARFIRKGLEEENYAVDLATDGITGFELGKQDHYDLIILDLMLPGMDGITLCRKLRAKNLNTPVLMLTAKSEVKDRVAGLESGADDYLIKPFSFEELLARTRALLRRKNNELVEMSVGEVKIDILSHRVFGADHEVLLRPKEFAILEYLMRNKGRVVSRTQILENVWGYDFDPTTNVVDVHIKALRTGMAEILKADPIRTVRGVGYMFIDGEGS